jgi:hypothetical protein
MTDIVKVQRPLMTNDADIPWLIYDKSHKRSQQLPQRVIPPAAVRALGNDPKGYFEGHWSSMFGWVIGKRVKNQDW